MASCLGISTESNLIKYAKISKEHNQIKLNSFGVKFVDDDKFETAISQIIEETESNNIPININLENEIYNSFEIFKGLKKKDMESILSSEFELLCDDKGYNFQALTSKFILSELPLENEKIEAIYVTVDKADLLSRKKRLSDYTLNGIFPIPITLKNLTEFRKENIAIVNIEDKTTITLISNGNIKSVNVIETGMRQILHSISRKENSYAKAYEACKNTTIYTMESTENLTPGNEYLQDIMPILYDIVSQVKQFTDTSFMSVQKIYLTGTATVINNIELYFQEYFNGIKCDILTPDFITGKTQNINIKEIVEVNSAISLALNGLNEELEELDFNTENGKPTNVFEQIKKILATDIKIGDKASGLGNSFKLDLNLKGSLDRIEKAMLLSIGTMLLIFIIFVTISLGLTHLLNERINEADTVIAESNAIIDTITNDTQKAQDKANEYADRIKKLEELNNQIKTDYKMKRAIPNLLNQIMAVIPREVQLTAIQNIKNNRILIKAQSLKYEELGYFGAVLKTQGILLDVQTTSGVRENNLVKIDIEGNLP